MIKTFGSIFLVLALSVALHAQDSLSYSIVSLSVGARKTFNKDMFHSPYTYQGVNSCLSLGYMRVSSKTKHVMEFNYSAGKIQSIVSPQASNQLLFLGYDFLINVTPRKRNFSLSIGPGLQTFMSRTKYLPEIALSNYYASAGLYLSLSGDIDYQLTGKSRLQLRVSIPVIGFAYRPDFEIHGKSLTKVVTMDDGFLFNAKLRYVFNLRSRTNVMASYDLNYLFFNAPRPINILSNALSIGVSRKF